MKFTATAGRKSRKSFAKEREKEILKMNSFCAFCEDFAAFASCLELMPKWTN